VIGFIRLIEKRKRDVKILARSLNKE